MFRHITADRSINYVYRVAKDTLCFSLLLLIIMISAQIPAAIFAEDGAQGWLQPFVDYGEIGMSALAMAGFAVVLLIETVNFFVPGRAPSSPGVVAGGDHLDRADPLKLREIVEARLKAKRRSRPGRR